MKTLCILYFHNVKCSGLDGPKVTYFEKQIKLLKEYFKIVDLDTVAERILSKSMPKQPEVAITFDDGFYSNYAYVEPILRKERIKATVFISTSHIYEKRVKRYNLFDYWEGKCSLKDIEQPYPNSLGNRVSTSEYKDHYMSEEELMEIEKGNLKVESHGHEHIKVFTAPLELIDVWSDRVAIEKYGRYVWLKKIYGENRVRKYRYLPVFKFASFHKTNITKPLIYELELIIDLYKKGRNIKDIQKSIEIKGYSESMEEAKKRIYNDLVNSKERLESLLNKKIIHLAWPFGEYSSISIETAKKAGYLALYTTKKKAITENSSIYEIERISVPKKDIELFIKLLKMIAWN